MSPRKGIRFQRHCLPAAYLHHLPSSDASNTEPEAERVQTFIPDNKNMWPLETFIRFHLHDRSVVCHDKTYTANSPREGTADRIMPQCSVDCSVSILNHKEAILDTTKGEIAIDTPFCKCSIHYPASSWCDHILQHHREVNSQRWNYCNTTMESTNNGIFHRIREKQCLVFGKQIENGLRKTLMSAYSCMGQWRTHDGVPSRNYPSPDTQMPEKFLL